MRFIPVVLLAGVAFRLSADPYDPGPDLEAGRFLKVQAEAEVRLKQNPVDALALAARSQALSAQQRLGEAWNDARLALAVAPQGPVRAQAHLAMGLALAGTALRERNLSSLGRAREALRNLEEATRQDPRLVRAWMSLGMAYQALPFMLGGSRSKAQECAHRLRAIDEAKGNALLGMLFSLDGKWTSAEAYFLKALERAPQDVEVVALYLEALGSRETRKVLGVEVQKKRLAEEARRLRPRFTTQTRALEALSDALLKAGQVEEAWTLAQGVLDKADAPSLLRLQLGKIAARSGSHLQEGLQALDRVLREPLEGGSGGYAAAHWRRGQILRALGRIPEARAAADQALRYDPKHPGAQELLGELK